MARVSFREEATPDGVLASAWLDGECIGEAFIGYEPLAEAVAPLVGSELPELVGARRRRFGRRFMRFAKKVARSKIVKGIAKVAQSPIFKAILPPQVSAALNVAQTAAKAIRAAKRGNRGARNAVRMAAQAARTDPVMRAGLNMAARLEAPAAQLSAAINRAEQKG